MEFINPEEFKNQPKEIQKVFMEWWQPQQFDLYLFDKHFLQIVKKYDEDFILPYKGNDVWEEKIHCIPLFTEGQLRKFIEDKTNKIINIEHFSRGYEIIDYSELGNDLLQAYWKVACEIAKGIVENE